MSRKKVQASFALLFMFSALAGLQFVKLADANPFSVYLLEMSDEQIDYTVCRINGGLWAKVDGTYPMTKSAIECPDQTGNITWFTFDTDSLPMVYPTPPGTTNISIKVDNTELGWSNYTQSFPDALHYTAIGDWPMIACTIDSVPDQFTLKIHYEHPIETINGSSMFLYDLNISPYLSPWSNKSTAHFNIKFETDVTDLKASTIATDGTVKDVDYAATEDDMVSLRVVSEYSKPLPGDLLISFTAKEGTGQGYVIVAATAIAVVVAVVLVVYRQKLKKNKAHHAK